MKNLGVCFGYGRLDMRDNTTEPVNIDIDQIYMLYCLV